MNHDKLKNTNEYPYDDEDNIDTYSGDSERYPSLDNHTSNVYCVAECNVGTFYEHRDLLCHPCDPLCKACNGPNATGCTECEFETDDGCVNKCLPGWEPIIGRKGPRRGIVCTKRVADDEGCQNTVVIVGAASGPGSFVVGVVVGVMICVCRRKRRGRKDVRGRNYLHADGFTAEMQSFTKETTDENHVIHVEEGYEEMGLPNQSKSRTPRAGQEPYLIPVAHDIHVEEGYEEMEFPNPSKSPTSRAEQEPFLTAVAKGGRIDIGKTKLGISTAPDISNSDKDRKCVVEITINTARYHINERLTDSDDGKVATDLNDDYMVPISVKAKDASTSGTIDTINSNDDITQNQTEQTQEVILGDGTLGEVYTHVTDNKGS